jgi:hypothetical protein
VAALAVARLASWLVSWWFAPLDAVNVNRFDPSVFTARGVVAIGYAGFAFALGVATGTLARRTLPAMAEVAAEGRSAVAAPRDGGPALRRGPRRDRPARRRRIHQRRVLPLRALRPRWPMRSWR